MPAKTLVESNRTLWQAWYTVQVGNTHQAYYSEEIENRPAQKQIAVNQHWWELDPPLTICETVIGAVSSAKDLKPIDFYVEKKTQLATNSTEGRINAGKLQVSLKPSGEKIETKVPNKAILSAALGLLIAESGKKNKRTITNFLAILEDPKDKKYAAQNGQFQLTGESEKIQGETCYAANTLFQGVQGKWWLTKEGKLCRLLLPNAGARIELTNESSAKKFLNQ